MIPHRLSDRLRRRFWGVRRWRSPPWSSAGILRGQRGGGPQSGRHRNRREGAQPGPNRRQGDRALKTLELTEATGSLPEYVRQAREEPLVLTSAGRAVAAVVPRSSHRARVHRDPAGGTAERLVGEGRAAAGEVRRGPVEPGQAGLDTASRRGRASGAAASGSRWRWLDMGAWLLDVGTAGYEVARSGHRCLDVDTAYEVPRYGHRCLHVGTAGDARVR